MLQQVEERLAALTSGDTPLLQAVRYSLIKTRGKRLRPLLLLTAVQDLQGSVAGALDPACALEMIHTYSLIHDDLPCMDNDDLRRGLPTLHRVVPEWQALLAGDYLLTFASEVVSHARDLTDGQRLSLVQLFSLRANDMVRGQTMDMLHAPNVDEMYRLKTGALIKLAMEAAGKIAGVSPQRQQALAQFGEHIGLAYQIIDDILDGGGYLSFAGEEGARQRAEEELRLGLAHIRGLTQLEALAHRLVHRTV